MDYRNYRIYQPVLVSTLAIAIGVLGGCLADNADAAPSASPREAVPTQPGNSNLSYSLGSGATWKHADLITAGYYTPWVTGTHMDMIVKWSDGEVTLYWSSTSNDPHKPFAGETQLAAPNGLWKNARAIAGVNAGVGNDGLVVLWRDGEVTLYKTVDQNGFHGEVQLAKPNALWRDHARLIAGGNYSGHNDPFLRDDLVVVWSDGEVSLYSDLANNKLGREKQLAAPNGTWKHARTISGGGFLTYGDLLVRWSDGEVTIYSGVSRGGFGQEHQVTAPNSLWTHATVVAGGDFTGDSSSNDIIVRWSDGEVSLYPDVDTRLHTKNQLVPPSK